MFYNTQPYLGAKTWCQHRALTEHCSDCPAKEKCAEIQKQCEELIEIAKENPVYYRQGELLRHVDMPWTMEE